MDRLLTPDQVGEALGFTADWARRELAREVPVVRIGGKVRFRERDVQAYINANVVQVVRAEEVRIVGQASDFHDWRKRRKQQAS